MDPHGDFIQGSTELPFVTMELFIYWLEMDYLSPIQLADDKDTSSNALHMRKSFGGKFSIWFELWAGRGNAPSELVLIFNAYMRRTDRLTVDFLGGRNSSEWSVKQFEHWLQKTFQSEKNSAGQPQAGVPTNTDPPYIAQRVEDYRKWSEIYRQAEASGNARRYLSDHDIPESTYYSKVKAHQLSKDSKKLGENLESELET